MILDSVQNLLTVSIPDSIRYAFQFVVIGFLWKQAIWKDPIYCWLHISTNQDEPSLDQELEPILPFQQTTGNP